jgi:hypothetical protein
MEKINYFDIVENEWREQYDREWGLGIVVSVRQNLNDDNERVWVAKILKDDDGYFIVPELVYRSVNRLRKTSYKIEDITIKLKDNK